jgi:hypothetical protein
MAVSVSIYTRHVVSVPLHIDDWLRVLENPDRAPLEKIQKQPELFSTPAVAPARGKTGRKGKPSTRLHPNRIH